MLLYLKKRMKIASGKQKRSWLAMTKQLTIKRQSFFLSKNTFIEEIIYEKISYKSKKLINSYALIKTNHFIYRDYPNASWEN